MKIKKWIKPELTIIVRNKPEEAVLWFCKGQAGAVRGPDTAESSCRWYNTWSLQCDTCSGAAGS